MDMLRAAACVCALLPVFAARAEIALDAPPPAPVSRPDLASQPAPVPLSTAPVVRPAPLPVRRPAAAFSDRLKLCNGPQWTGDFVAWSQAGVEWRRRANATTVTIPLAQVAGMQLNQTMPKAGAFEPHLVAFADGTVLPGHVTDLSAEKIVVATWFAGEMTADARAMRRFGPELEKRPTPEEQSLGAMREFRAARTREARALSYQRVVEAGLRLERSRRETAQKNTRTCLVRLATDEEVRCAAFEIRSGKARLRVDWGLLEIPSERVTGFAWPAVAPDKSAPCPSGLRAVTLNGPHGGRILLRIDKIADGKLAGVSAIFGKVEIATDAVAAIE